MTTEARFQITAHTVYGMESSDVYGAPLDAQRVARTMLREAGDFYILLDRRNGLERRFNFDGRYVVEESAATREPWKALTERCAQWVRGRQCDNYVSDGRRYCAVHDRSAATREP
jgi:hypothetical protein